MTSMALSQYPSNSFPGLAGSTGTRVDSAAKHIMACKVHSGMLAGWCENGQNSNNHMHIHKQKYCMTRDELVLNVGMPLNSTSNMIKPGQAYPAVVTTLGDMSAQTQKMLALLYHNSKTGADFLQNKKFIQKMASGKVETLSSVFAMTDAQNCDWRKITLELKNMPYFIAQGYSLGIAYASALSGDTVGSVLIGGMCTVMNGAFECKAGQMIQWYFDFERNCFYQDNEYSKQGMTVAGTRKEPFQSRNSTGDNDKQRIESLQRIMNSGKQDTESEKSREKFHQRALGAMDSYPHGGKSDCKQLIAYPKPYLLDADGLDHYGDKIRIFAKCITGARKHEMMDIMLMTQSL
tara:strand:- start:34397 stop:35443 length:1047 start_codon:yes stop_codon:yes gene_type:complete